MEDCLWQADDRRVPGQQLILSSYSLDLPLKVVAMLEVAQQPQAANRMSNLDPIGSRNFLPLLYISTLKSLPLPSSPLPFAHRACRTSSCPDDGGLVLMEGTAMSRMQAEVEGAEYKCGTNVIRTDHTSGHTPCMYPHA